MPRTKNWKTLWFLNQDDEARPAEETVTEARGMLSGGQQTFLAEQVLQMPLHPLYSESHLRSSIKNECGCVQCQGLVR